MSEVTLKLFRINTLLMIHIYLAIYFTNKASYEAMFKTSEMDVDFIKDHHVI